jgi:hypothetical protein
MGGLPGHRDPAGFTLTREEADMTHNRGRKHDRQIAEETPGPRDPQNVCPAHGTSLVYQHDEKWWRCPAAHCLFKIHQQDILQEFMSSLRRSEDDMQILAGTIICADKTQKRFGTEQVLAIEQDLREMRLP